MKCLLLMHQNPDPMVSQWPTTQEGEWTAVSYDAYVDRMSDMPVVIEQALSRLELDFTVYDRVVFVPPKMSNTVLPFFDELLRLVHEDVVPEQLIVIKASGGYKPCPEYPIYRTQCA